MVENANFRLCDRQYLSVNRFSISEAGFVDELSGKEKCRKDQSFQVLSDIHEIRRF